VSIDDLPFGAKKCLLASGKQLDVYRIVKVASTANPLLINSLRSNAALKKPPRGPEKHSPAIYQGISAYADRSDAEDNAREFPQLGEHIAHLQLEGTDKITYAHWGPKTHLTVWADAALLLDSIVDIRPIVR
jgi:hypothetical protein